MAHRFEQFWAVYPRRVAKGAARKSFEKALKIATFEEIMAGLSRQLPYYASREHEFIPHPSTWLNQERWADEPQPIRVPQKPSWQRRTIADVAREIEADFLDFGAPVSLPSLARN